MSTLKRPSVSFSLQERDLALLRALFESRVMTAAHVAALNFDGKTEAAKKRLQKLKAAGLIGDRRRAVNEPSVLFIAKKGLSMLGGHGVLQEYPQLSSAALEKRSLVSDLTIRHELEVMDVKAAFHAALSDSQALSLAEFCTWPQLHEFEKGVLVKPDGFIRIQDKNAGDGLSEHTFFMEVDRSTEALDTVVSKARAYIEYYKSGDFAARNGAPRSAFKDYPFRALIVLKTAERRNNLVERLLQNLPPILSQVYVSTLGEVRDNPLGAVWIRPIDYRDAARGTAFEVERSQHRFGYQRQTARDLFIEANVKKCALL